MLARMQEELEYLYRLERFGIKPGLSVMEQLMGALGYPERNFKSIHVTGTNGKGSVCAMMESVLREAGYTTALYTSPHLYRFNERIQIRGVAISDEDLIALIREIRKVIEKENIQATFFEFTTALAFLYFSRANIDIAVIEVGMGGLLDATNVITPLVSVITNVGLDHMEFLGDTTEKITAEKAGIIKEGVPVVVGQMDLKLVEIIKKVAGAKHASIILANDTAKIRLISSDFDGQVVDIGFGGLDTLVTLPLLGEHQIQNMSIAVVAMLEIFPEISMSVIASGIAKTKWEGRVQIVSKQPLIIVDGAHNSDGAHALVTFLETVPMCDVLVYAAKKGKNIEEVLSLLLPKCKRVIVTKGSYMPEDPEVIASYIRTMGKVVEVRDSVIDAVSLGYSYIPKDGILLVAGSLYMIPEALAYLKQSAV
jgi:dihydrofolate synthase/folylpolyglutamate synthase